MQKHCYYVTLSYHAGTSGNSAIRCSRASWQTTPTLADLGVQRVLDQVGAPKNAAWSPNSSTLYMTEGGKRSILAFAFDVASGRVGPGKVFMSGDSNIGMPNGITVDS